MIGFPWMIAGYGEYSRKDKTQNKLYDIRLGMSHADVQKFVRNPIEKKKIDSYNVEVYSLSEVYWYTNALLIFEEDYLVGIIRGVTTTPILNYYQSL